MGLSFNKNKTVSNNYCLVSRLIFSVILIQIVFISQAQTQIDYVTVGNCSVLPDPNISCNIIFDVYNKPTGIATTVTAPDWCCVVDGDGQCIPGAFYQCGGTSTTTTDYFEDTNDCGSDPSGIEWHPAISITAPSSQSFCTTQAITLKGTSDWGSYRWYYRLSTGDWQLFKTTTTENISASIQDIFGSGYSASDLNKNFYLTYNVGTGCDVSSNNAGQVGPYSFSNTPLSASTISKQEIKCKGSNDGSVTVASFNRSLLSGESVQSVSLYTQQTALPAYFVKSSSGGTVSGISPGTYYLLVESNVVPCNTPATLYGPITFTDPTLVTFTPISSQALCNGGNTGSIAVAPSGGSGTGYQYSKDNGVLYQVSNVLSGLTAGTYTVVVKDGNGCVATKQDVVVTQPIAISISASLSSDVSCFGGTNGKITVTASGGTNTLTYSKDGSVFQSSNIITGLAAGTYTITVKDGNNCTNTSSPVTVSSPSLMDATLTPTDALCNGSPNGVITVGSVSGGSGSFTYSLNGTTFQSSNVFTSVSASTYTITIKDVNNCTISKPVTIGQPLAITSTLSETPVTCFGGSDGSLKITASNGTSPYTYSKDGTTYQVSNTFTSLSASLYTLKIKDSNGCVGTSSYTVTSNPVITGTILPVTPVRCKGESTGSLNLTPTGGVSPYTFSWSNGMATEDINGISAGNYSVVIKDSKGCQQNVNYTLTEPLALSVSAVLSDYNGFNISCFGSSNGSIDETVTGGTAPYTYAWSTSATSQDLSGLTSGHYDVVVTDNRGCISTKGFDLNTPAQHTVAVTNLKNISCFGDSDGAITLTSTGGAGSYQFSKDGTTWQTSSVFSGLLAGNYNLKARDMNTCPATVSTTLTSPALLQIATTQQNTVCGQDNGTALATVIGGTPNYSYAWFNSDNTQIENNADIKNIGAGIYRVDVTDQNGCFKSKTVTISSSNGPVIAVSSTTPTSCYESFDGTSTISVSQGQTPYTVLWPTGQTTYQGTGLSRGDQIVQVSDGSGCKVFKTITIPSPDSLSIETFAIQNPTCSYKQDGSIEITVLGGNGGNSYMWNTGDMTTSIHALPGGTYSVAVTDSKACKKTKDFILITPDRFVIDLGKDIEVCEGQVVKLGIDLPNTLFTWTSKDGDFSHDEYITVNKPGVYTLKATNENGCDAEDNVELILNESLLETDFLITREAYVGDSVIAIDISWPMPENISWTFDKEANVIYAGQDWSIIQFDKEGTYTVSMSAVLGGCSGEFSQTITILKRDESLAGGRSDTQALLQEVSLYPNPSNGKFDVSIGLREIHAVTIQLVSLSGNRMIFTENLSDSDYYERNYNFPNLQSGIYFLLVKAGKESKMIRIAIL